MFLNNRYKSSDRYNWFFITVLNFLANYSKHCVIVFQCTATSAASEPRQIKGKQVNVLVDRKLLFKYLLLCFVLNYQLNFIGRF